MSNTKALYDVIHAYMTTRSEARDTYLKTLERLEKARGSRLYDEEVTKARNARTVTVTAAQREAKETMRDILRAMANNADKIAMIPPSAEMLNILQLLKMKERITRSELDGAANAMDGNPVALSLLDELAAKNEIYGTGYARRMARQAYTPQTAREIIKDLGKSCLSIINNESGANRNALQVSQMHQNLYGGSFDPDTLPQEKAFENELEFYRSVNIPYEPFMRAVD